MYGGGDQFLADAGFADNHRCRFARADDADHFSQFGHRRGLAEQRLPRGGIRLSPEKFVVAAHRTDGESATHDEVERVRADRLGQVIGCALLDRGDGLVDRAVGGQHQHGAYLGQLGHALQPAGVRQLGVE